MTLRQWNKRQLAVLGRYCRIHRVEVEPDGWKSLAARYARKHAEVRARLVA